MSNDHPDSSLMPMPLAFNTRGGVPLESAGAFRDAEGRWWSIQARKVTDLRDVRSVRQDQHGRTGHVSFVRLQRRPDWLTPKDKSNLQIALELNQLLYRGDIVTFRTQDEADESFKSAHEARGMFVR